MLKKVMMEEANQKAEGKKQIVKSIKNDFRQCLYNILNKGMGGDSKVFSLGVAALNCRPSRCSSHEHNKRIGSTG